MKQARCRDIADLDAFYPERGGSTKEARALCAECLVRAECLAFALGNQDCLEHGIFGGTSPKERRLVQRVRKKRPYRRRSGLGQGLWRST